MPMPTCHREATLKEDGMMCPILTASAFVRDPCEIACIGRRCMAWRFMETHINDPAGGHDLVPSGDTHGYCGLAGHPAPMFHVGGR